MDVKHSELPWKVGYKTYRKDVGEEFNRYTIMIEPTNAVITTNALEPKRRDFLQKRANADAAFIVETANSYYPDKALIEGYANAVVVLPDGAKAQKGDLVCGNVIGIKRVGHFAFREQGSEHMQPGAIWLEEGGYINQLDRIIQRNGKPVIYESMLKRADLTHRSAIDDVKELWFKEEK